MIFNILICFLHHGSDGISIRHIVLHFPDRVGDKSIGDTELVTHVLDGKHIIYHLLSQPEHLKVSEIDSVDAGVDRCLGAAHIEILV